MSYSSNYTSLTKANHAASHVHSNLQNTSTSNHTSIAFPSSKALWLLSIGYPSSMAWLLFWAQFAPGFRFLTTPKSAEGTRLGLSRLLG